MGRQCSVVVDVPSGPTSAARQARLARRLQREGRSLLADQLQTRLRRRPRPRQAGQDNGCAKILASAGRRRARPAELGADRPPSGAMMLRPRPDQDQQHRQQQQQQQQLSRRQMWPTSGQRADYAINSAAPAAATLARPPASRARGVSLLHQRRRRDHSPDAGGEHAARPDIDQAGAEVDEMSLVREASRGHEWHWSEHDKSHECILSDDKLTVTIHPNCSESAAACRGSQALKRDGNYYYWELLVLDKAYGTSVMFGLCTAGQRLHQPEYCNLIGLDANGWSLSHKGLIWHNGAHRQYAPLFPANRPIRLGLLLNTMRGELTYFMEGRSLGVAFCGLNDIAAELYPVVGSTAKCTRIRLLGAYCGYVSLLERSCFTVIKSSANPAALLEYLAATYQLPASLLEYLAQAARHCASQTAIKTKPGGDDEDDGCGDGGPMNNENQCKILGILQRREAQS